MSAFNAAALGQAIGNGLTAAGTHSARAAGAANAASKQAQSAQGAFNQESANLANSIADNRLASQYDYNSAMMQAANAYNTDMWERTAAWNEAMWEKQANFNAEQAQKNRDWSSNEAKILREWQEQMSNTQYQRAIKDMSAAGLNPILAVTGGGINTGVPGGAMGQSSTASVGGAQMSSAQSAMTSGGLLQGQSASEGNYTGQMEYLGGMLGLLSSAFDGISSAIKSFGGLGDFGEGLAKAIGELFTGNKTEINIGSSIGSLGKQIDKAYENWDKSKFGKTFLEYPKYTYDYWKNKLNK